MVHYSPIGIIRTPFKEKAGMPIQAGGAGGFQGTIELNEELAPGLLDLDGFSHILLIYHFHQSAGFDLQVTPFLDDKKHGVFATRAPKRPNPVGISVVRLLDINHNILTIENVDMLDGTPLLDIKPYLPDFDIHEVKKSGWLEDKAGKIDETLSDDRFG